MHSAKGERGIENEDTVLHNDVTKKSKEIEASVGVMSFEKLDDMLAEADCVLVAAPFDGQRY